jgi:hypothetical protein
VTILLGEGLQTSAPVPFKKSVMSNYTLRISSVLIAIAIIGGSAFGDSYRPFQTTRFYSANRRYFVEVRENKRATLYRNGRISRRIWSRSLPELPRKLFVTDDGLGVAMVDSYYGNNCVADSPAVVIFGHNGKELSRHLLKDVSDLSRTARTTSMCYWVHDAEIYPDSHSLTIQTFIAEHDLSKRGNINSPDDPEKKGEPALATKPYQTLTFNLINGLLVSRQNVAAH